MRAGTYVLDYTFKLIACFSCEGCVSLFWGVGMDRAP